MTTIARITSRAGQATVRVDVDYDGLRPLRALFADLTMIGWQAPAFTPPPRDAIDWSMPNPETGKRRRRSRQPLRRLHPRIELEEQHTDTGTPRGRQHAAPPAAGTDQPGLSRSWKKANTWSSARRVG
jgi:hypothetical protein